MHLGFGNVPDWLSGFGTVATLAVALRVLVRDAQTAGPKNKIDRHGRLDW
jgi:hypothetical protein